MATLRNSRTGGYYHDVPDDDAQAMADEWNDGLGRRDWRVEYSAPLPAFSAAIGGLFS